MSCDCCGKDITGNFINVNGGALLESKDDPDSSSWSDRLHPFLSINLHDDNNEEYTSAEIVPDDKNSMGQFEWYFCSKKCVRKFFNDWLDRIPDVGECNGD